MNAYLLSLYSVLFIVPYEISHLMLLLTDNHQAPVYNILWITDHLSHEYIVAAASMPMHFACCSFNY